MKLAGTFLSNIAIENSVASCPEACHASYESHAAIGTPIKFTKSFQAKAKANEKVPIPIINLSTFTLKTVIKS